MKFINKTAISALAMLGVATAALAQTYTTEGDSRYYTVSRGRLDAGTAVTDRTFFDTRSDVAVSYKCGTAVSVTLLWRLTDGTVVSSTGPVACDSTARVATSTGPQLAQAFAPSPTTTVSTSAGGVSSSVVETNRQYR